MDHRAAEKDGWAFTQGPCVDDTRKAKAMTAMYMLGVDIDSGQNLDEVKATIEAKGLACAGYTTHSHLKTKTEIVKDTFQKWEADNSGLGYAEYLMEIHGLVEEVARSAEYIGEGQIVGGFSIKLKHAPIPKCRLVFPLKMPLVFAEMGMTHKDAIDQWKRIYVGFCNDMGFFYDESCTDPSRLFYFPRHQI